MLGQPASEAVAQPKGCLRMTADKQQPHFFNGSSLVFVCVFTMCCHTEG